MKDFDDEIVAGNIVLMDSKRVYDQFFTYMPKIGEDAQSLATISAIEAAICVGKDFDFEGSMIPGICEFYTSWNPEYEINYLITKTSKKYDKLNALRTLLRV